MTKLYNKLMEIVLSGGSISEDEALALTSIEELPDILDCLSSANRIRNHFKGNEIDLCGIINAKSGKCSEDCIFCAQSGNYKTEIDEYPLMSVEEILNQTKYISTMFVKRVGIVTSGKKISSTDEITSLCESVKEIKNNMPLSCCASLGILSKEDLIRLKESGLERYHHNLETSESFFPNICTTHTYKQRVDTILAAKSIGLKVCSGALFGLGESPKQRVELAFDLKRLDVDMIPLNFLHPIAGTPTEKNQQIPPLEILKIIAMFRFVLPDRDIRICGGREYNLRGLQPLVFVAGANGLMVGNYLTTQGRNYKMDIQDILDLGLHLSK